MFSINTNRKPFSAKDKGFYIALIVCVVAVGIGSWAMLKYSKNTGFTVPADIPLISEDVFYPKTSEPTMAATPNSSLATPKANASNKTAAFIWPVSGDIMLPYSVDALIYTPTMADWRTHSGIDIKSDIGTGVSAVADGKIVSVDKGGMLGTTVKIEHSNGLVSVYSNLDENVKVSVGKNIGMGELIGSVGQTAVSEAGTEPHLHLEMTLNGNSVNPMDYLPS